MERVDEIKATMKAFEDQLASLQAELHAKDSKTHAYILAKLEQRKQAGKR